jgi:transcriptional regulator with XRE-family HTH domain
MWNMAGRVGEEIRRRRKAEDPPYHTQAGLARKLRVRQQDVARWENGTLPRDQRKLERLAGYLEVTPGDLVRLHHAENDPHVKIGELADQVDDNRRHLDEVGQQIRELADEVRELAGEVRRLRSRDR